ncbi:MAG: glycosyltransferase family 4 protein [Anaerolineaceae bacterium]|nr:glycosyltransferase family 4 protein [Anaerolineaceae bacterium]
MKVIFFANTDWYLHNFRRNLAEALRHHGHDLLLVSPPGPYAERLVQAGFRWQPLLLDRQGNNPLKDLGAIYRIYRLYRQEKPDLVHHFTIKCVLYGSFAARLSGVPSVINSITGLGHVFNTRSGKTRWMRGLAAGMYRLALPGSQVIFQNQDNLDAFVRMNLVRPEQCHIIRGSGVDLTQFSPVTEPGGTPLVILPARMLREKGISEFVQAARLLKSRGVTARFALVGDCDPGNPSSYTEEEICAWQDEKVIEWWGWREDMSNVYAQSNVVCLPSFGEGVPRTLIEAAASQRAIVTTDVPGCREIVQHTVNGYLVPLGNIEALADALQELLAQPALRAQMAHNGRTIAEQFFSSPTVVSQTFDIYTQSSGGSL